MSGRGRSWVFRSVVTFLALSAVGLATAGGLYAGGIWSPIRADGATETDEIEEDPLIGPNHYASAEAVCELLTPEDLGFALGYVYEDGIEPPVTWPALFGNPGMTRCLYMTEGQGETVTLGVVYAYADRVFQDAVDRFDQEGNVTDVPGLGRRAVWTQTPRQLLVLTDDKFVALNLPMAYMTEAEQLERARRLAEKVIGRLR